MSQVGFVLGRGLLLQHLLAYVLDGMVDSQLQDGLDAATRVGLHLKKSVDIPGIQDQRFIETLGSMAATGRLPVSRMACI